MTPEAITIQKPAGAAAQLILLFHGVGSNAQSMEPLGRRLAERFPQAMVVAVQSPLPSDFPGGFQWFSVVGVTEDNRAARIAEALPAFARCVAHWQQEAGVGPQATALVGFSQGAIMALESTLHSPALASRVVSISGRYARLPEAGDYAGTVHFLHGKEDAVIPYSHTVMAAHRLRDLGWDTTAEVLPFVGHTVHPEFVDLLLEKLSNHISHRIWKEAMQSPPESGT